MIFLTQKYKDQILKKYPSNDIFSSLRAMFLNNDLNVHLHFDQHQNMQIMFDDQHRVFDTDSMETIDSLAVYLGMAVALYDNETSYREVSDDPHLSFDDANIQSALQSKLPESVYETTKNVEERYQAFWEKETEKPNSAIFREKALAKKAAIEKLMEQLQDHENVLRFAIRQQKRMNLNPIDLLPLSFAVVTRKNQHYSWLTTTLTSPWPETNFFGIRSVWVVKRAVWAAFVCDNYASTCSFLLGAAYGSILSEKADSIISPKIMGRND